MKLSGNADHFNDSLLNGWNRQVRLRENKFKGE
jgi:hypothetical protein